MAQGVRDSAPDAQIVCMPMADGGEGTAESVQRADLVQHHG
ncbi:glycerate kinase, partial [Pseudomonas aeruginosa]|nr:glycerate kinase [Pseudomonas aeruginosa]